MPRNLSSDMLTALAGKSVQPFYMVHIAFLSDDVYLWTGIGAVTWNGHDWTGVGTFGGVSPITQTDDLSAENITLFLSGVPSGLVNSTLTECRQNLPVEVWVGFLDDTGVIIVDPAKGFTGSIDVPTIQDSGETVTISITAENPLVALQRASQRRYTNDDQKIDFPTDDGFQFVPLIQEWNGAWGTPGHGLPAGALAQIIGGTHSKHNID
jgi:hypothetical protein